MYVVTYKSYFAVLEAIVTDQTTCTKQNNVCRKSAGYDNNIWSFKNSFQKYLI